MVRKAGIMILGGIAILAAACTGKTNPGSAAVPPSAPAPASATPGPPVGSTDVPPLVPSKRSLASFAQPSAAQACFDRKSESYTGIVDAHFHPRPFGGTAMSPAQVVEMLDKTGVRFVNYFGIGQSLDMASSCTYYLDCPGTAALPSIKNDFVNGEDVKNYPHENLHIVLSITSLDLANPAGAVDTIRLYDKEFPGMFKWAGELNVIKQALLANKAEPATIASIDRWAPFMKVL